MSLQMMVFLAAVACCSAGYAESADEIKAKIQKLEAQIKGGADPDLVKPYLDKFKKQLAEMDTASPTPEPSVKASRTQKATAPQPDPKPVSVEAKRTKPVAATPTPKTTKRRPNKRERALAFLKTTSVEDRIDRYSQLAKLIRLAKVELVQVKNSGKTWKDMKSEVREIQDQLVAHQKEYDLLSESLGPLRAIAAIPMEQPVVGSSGASKLHSPSLDTDKLKFKGHMRYRHENQNATGWNSALGGGNGRAREGVNLFRLRGDFVYQANDRVKVGFSPQAVKGLGADEFVTSGSADTTAENTQRETSGFIVNPEVDFYEAYVDYEFSKLLSVKLGRQVLAYGDHLIIGSLPWDINARSFDALKFTLKTGQVKTDLFVSQISDDATTTENDDDKNLYGLYTQFGDVGLFKELDLYLLRQDDDGLTTEVNTFGLRFKGVKSGFFYRLETGVQNGLIAGEGIEDGYQVDTDLGFVSKALDFKLGYSQAGIDYLQLYPTAHKFLGFADIFGRRNILSYRATASWKSSFGFSAHLFFHQFNRVETSVAPYGLTLGQHTNNGNSDADDLGSEVDLVLKQKFLGSSQIHLGVNIFTPGEYFEDQPEEDSDETRNFTYVQIITNF